MQPWGSQREVEKPKPMRAARQMSVAQLPEGTRDQAMRSVDAASDAYAQVEVGGCGLHVCWIDGEWQVWLNTEDATFTGLCVSTGATRDLAITEAVATLEAAVQSLQQPGGGHMIVRLLEIDGRTLVAALEVPRVDTVPKVAVWNERAFILLSATHTDTVAANYVETVSLRLELPAEAGR